MTDLQAFAATLGDEPLSVDDVRAAWQAWAIVHAPHEVRPPSDAFHELVRRRAAAVGARTSDAPLSGWRFDGRLRTSQRLVLDGVTVAPPDPLHIVAPPGAGKTLIGLLIAARRGSRTLVLTPTTTIQRQWVNTARTLAPTAAAVSDAPTALGDCTVLTYQRVSVLGREAPGGAFEPLARERWADELRESGRDDAGAWLTALATDNPAAFARGIQRRAKAVRSRLSREDPAHLAAALHPNARELADALVAHGVETIVLDECHHLLDHWALVVAYLASRIRAEGRSPLLIGLTATLPSPQDKASYENYTGLLGDVDFETPTPAVVKEGNLAPYRDLAWFTTPTAEELLFLRTQDEHLSMLVSETIGSGEGIRFLRELLGAPAPDDVDAALSGTVDVDAVNAAFAADFGTAEAAARMLVRVAPTDDLVALLPDVGGAIGDTEMRVLARYLVERVLPVPARAAAWEHARRLLADFGWTLTDRGLRRGRDPIDTLLASSAAKDLAACDILRNELATEDGERVRTVVVCDFATHGNRAGRSGGAGALRTFDVLVADSVTVPLMPVLVTAKHLRIATRDQLTLVPRLAALLGVEPTVAAATQCSTEVSFAGVGAARIVAAVSSLVSDGFVRVLVGTRGLLGEGWDCPAVNTLIDLTSVTTSSATQQLRGRTFRLDASWPQKVAHNWTVTAVTDGGDTGDRHADVRRLHRKLGRLWGVDDDGTVVRGVSHTLTAAQSALLDVTTRTTVTALADRLNEKRPVISRAETRRLWRVGDPFVGEEQHVLEVATRRSPRAVLNPPRLEWTLGGLAGGGTAAAVAAGVFITPALAAGVPVGLAIAAVGVGGTAIAINAISDLVRLLSRRIDPVGGHATVAHAVLDGLRAAGVVRSPATVEIRREGDGISVRLDGGTRAEQDALRLALAELYGPVRTPRFLLEMDPSLNTRGPAAGRSGPAVRGAQGFVLRLAARFAGDGTGPLLAVPTAIGRRREVAEAFTKAWRKRVGPVLLHESATNASLVIEARRRSDVRSVPAAVRDVWA